VIIDHHMHHHASLLPVTAVTLRLFNHFGLNLSTETGANDRRIHLRFFVGCTPGCTGQPEHHGGQLKCLAEEKVRKESHPSGQKLQLGIRHCITDHHRFSALGLSGDNRLGLICLPPPENFRSSCRRSAINVSFLFGKKLSS
jgi:hypothetical protein